MGIPDSEYAIRFIFEIPVNADACFVIICTSDVLLLQILLCDRCDAGYHTACLRPPIMVIPEDDWFCPLCEHVNSMCCIVKTCLLECVSEL